MACHHLSERPSRLHPLGRLTRLGFTVSLFCWTALTGCARKTDTGAGDWRAEIDSVGTTVTVRTVSGSVWGAFPALIEEASIGTADGEEAYLLGEVTGLAISDGRILILDASVPTVRMYDRNGHHFRDIGRGGSGPGEFQLPWSLEVDPPTGLIFVRDEMQARINVYLADGEFLQQIRLAHGLMTSIPMVISGDGLVFTPILLRLPTGLRDAWAAYSFEGAADDTVAAPVSAYAAPELEYLDDEGEPFTTVVPFSPEHLWTLTPDLAVAHGVSDAYRLEIRHRDGRVTVIERTVEPVPIEPEEQDWYRRRLTARIRRTDPGWNWRGEPIPDSKPFFDDLVPDREGRLWVLRRGPGIRLEEGNAAAETYDEFVAAPCWRESWTFDVFEVSGRFLGSVTVPDGFRSFPQPDIVGDRILCLVHDENDVPRVKRFRLDLER